MNLLHVKLDTKMFNTIMNNTSSYSLGFLDGVELSQLEFNTKLAEFTTDALYKYIDSQARMNPNMLHHVYEWNQTGNPEGRLFKIKYKASQRIINITGKFLSSKSLSNTSTEPFINKADIMENGITIQVKPKNSNVLVFENMGETVFTTNTVIISHPGGDEVAGSFGRTVDSFFDTYFVNSLLLPLINSLQRAEEFTNNFSSGSKGGKGVGIRAGRKYLSSSIGATAIE